ncbi:Polyprenyl synthetase [Trema orientale]|uniref:Polyprenyl synthetase n=1 Tax=Trema orientale TaxID=63057 RepID=A0A2P5EXQ6_TREOI|nr:Polyprenyl synthetase [Trema orientale]
MADLKGKFMNVLIYGFMIIELTSVADDRLQCSWREAKSQPICYQQLQDVERRERTNRKGNLPGQCSCYKHTFWYLMTLWTTHTCGVASVAGIEFPRFVPKVDMSNDGVILRTHISRILKDHFRDKPYHVDLLDLFNEVACALLMSGENLDNHVDVKNILVEMGIYFQVQVGTDVEDFKCSWLVVKAYELSNEEQKKILYENYGKTNPEKGCENYETKMYEKLTAFIEAQPVTQQSYSSTIEVLLG